MTIYIFSVSKENWEVIKANNVMGIKGRRAQSLLDHILIGDKCIIYITRISGFIGVYTISSKSVKKKINWPNDNFNLLLDIKPIEVLEKPIKVKDHIKNLDFIKNKVKWFTHFRVPNKISEKDYKYIMNLFLKYK